MKHSIEEAIELAISRGGKCLSTEYSNKDKHLLWECVKGHQWKASFSNVSHGGTWCPKCSRVKNSLEEMQEIARSRGGKCLSEKYINIITKLEWECAEGHRWWATPNNVIKLNSWCAKCFYARRRKK